MQPPSPHEMSSTGKLPLELERVIFEIAAQDRTTIPPLLLVAHRVRLWQMISGSASQNISSYPVSSLCIRLEPMLYKVLRLDTVAVTVSAIKSIQLRPADFLASIVRHVLVYSSTHSLSRDDFASFLQSCPGITTLAILGNVLGPYLLPILGAMQIQRLSLDVGQLFRDEASGEEEPINLEHPLFSTVTHLDVFDDFETFVDDPEVASEWVQSLCALPALTHLAFSTPAMEVLRSALDSCPGLRVLLVAFPATEIDDAKGYMEYVAPDVTDMRFVVATYADYYDDWETGARGGHDIWAHAEEFIARKRRGEVEEGPASDKQHKRARVTGCFSFEFMTQEEFEEEEEESSAEDTE
ncbi:hypothetical protein DFH06DRAFT_1488155 [Mycena polygramma]|nr:hypothetical protein DFH06DRAFT_1488155 [Mycena polygramma]